MPRSSIAESLQSFAMESISRHAHGRRARLGMLPAIAANRAGAGEERVARLHARGVDEAGPRARLVRGAPAARPYRRSGDRRGAGVHARRRHLRARPSARSELRHRPAALGERRARAPVVPALHGHRHRRARGRASRAAPHGGARAARREQHRGQGPPGHGQRLDPRAYRSHRLDPATDAWIDTGTFVDERPMSRQDVLPDGGRLYMVSRFDGTPPVSRLLRFTYSPASRSHVLDPGFPVSIPGGGTESMTLARDSGGTLWIAYTLNDQVFVATTLGSDLDWSAPLVVPVAEGTTVRPDDIAGVQRLQGGIGVFWSNQLTDKFYFAVHRDGAPAADPAAWQLEIAAAGGRVADDHFNLKLASDGRLFAAVKTSHHTPSSALIGLLVRSPAGVWSPLHEVTDVASKPTPPLCVLDEAARRVYVFYSLDQSAIYYKTSDLDSLSL